MPNYSHNQKNHMKKKHVVHRMVNKTVFEEGGCWLWTGSQDGRGYGQVRLVPGMNPEKVHRISAFFFLDYSGWKYDLVLHKIDCPNKHCWNPDHLYIGTYSDNMWDRVVSS